MIVRSEDLLLQLATRRQGEDLVIHEAEQPKFDLLQYQLAKFGDDGLVEKVARILRKFRMEDQEQGQ